MTACLKFLSNDILMEFQELTTSQEEITCNFNYYGKNSRTKAVSLSGTALWNQRANQVILHRIVMLQCVVTEPWAANLVLGQPWSQTQDSFENPPLPPATSTLRKTYCIHPKVLLSNVCSKNGYLPGVDHVLVTISSRCHSFDHHDCLSKWAHCIPALQSRKWKQEAPGHTSDITKSLIRQVLSCLPYCSLPCWAPHQCSHTIPFSPVQLRTEHTEQKECLWTSPYSEALKFDSQPSLRITQIESRD
jgi:hypothetical protein